MDAPRPRTVDLRSDTVTKPTAAMRAAIAAAEVGDDDSCEDPTVNALEAHVAALLGKESALFVTSGTMANQLAIHLHTRPGDEVLLHADAHPLHHEAGAAAALSGVQLRPLPGPRGQFRPADVRAALRPTVHNYPRSRLLLVENTHNLSGGSVWPLAAVADVAEAAHGAGLAVHLDGARLWNACAATGHAPAEYAAHADTVSVCFSKGLGAPIGSAIAGPRAAIHEARRIRKRLGGGWRQAGLLAAAALHALDHHRARLLEDHENARILAAGLRGLPGLRVPDLVETNIVLLPLDDDAPEAAALAGRLAAEGVRVSALGPRLLRAVTHLDVDRAGIERAVQAFRAVLHAIP